MTYTNKRRNYDRHMFKLNVSKARKKEVHKKK
jgi:hypothetical protein